MPWIIDKDMAAVPGAEPRTDGNATGLTGPSSFKGDGSELAQEFRLLGGDREVCYEGRSYARDSAPLNQFGKRVAGCTVIQYKVGGVWRDLEEPPRPRRPRPALDWDKMLALIPNHICPCVNLQDSFWCIESGRDAERWPVDARGMLT